MVTPTTPPLQPRTPYIPQNLVGTPVHHIMQNPAIHSNSTIGQVPTRGQPRLHISIRGKPPFICQTPVVTQSMVGGQPSFPGNPPQSWEPPQGGTFHQPYQGGLSYPNPQGGISNPNPSRLHSRQPFLGVSIPTWGPQGQQSYPAQGKKFYPPQGQTIYPPQGKIVYPC
jgi:hypothetical protein